MPTIFEDKISTFEIAEVNVEKILDSNFDCLLLIGVTKSVAIIVKLLFYILIRTI